MLLTLGYVFVGAALYGYFARKEDEETKETESSEVESSSLIRSGKGEITLPPCEIVAVELGPLSGASKAVLQIMNKECRPVDVSYEKKYVKITPTRYQTNVVLRAKREAGMPITVYYRV